MKKFLVLILAAAVALTARAQSSPTVSIPWRNVSKSGSSLADLATRSASDLNSGTLAAARLPSYLQGVASGSYLDLIGGIGSPASGHAQYGGSGSYGASIIGNGSAYDFGLFNKNGTDVMHVATGGTTVVFAGTINTTAATGNPTISATMTSAGGAGHFPLFQLIDSRTSGTTWNIENGRTLGLLSLRSNSGDQVTINGTTGATTLVGTLTVGTNTAPSIPSSPRAVFTHTTTAAGAPTIAVEGSPGGYGAGIDFVSALGDAVTTFKPMAKIVSDGTAPWSSTASTQDANLAFWTSVDGSLVNTATFEGTRATFYGNVFVSDTLVNRANNKGIFTGTGDNFGFLWTGTNGEMSTASGSIILKPASAVALTLAASGMATFSGYVDLLGTSSRLSFTDTGAGTSRNWRIAASESAEGDFLVQVSSAANLAPSVTALGFDRVGIATFPVQLIGKGTATNDNAATGYIGEYVSSTLAAGSAINLTTATAANITSLSLTAGDWDVTGLAIFSQGPATVGQKYIGSISTTAATVSTTETNNAQTSALTSTSSRAGNLTVPTVRVSIASTTTLYLVAKATFTTDTMSGYGTITARRQRRTKPKRKSRFAAIAA